MGLSILSWDKSSAVGTKTDSAEFSEAGIYQIDVTAYELQYLNRNI
ncbi:MAG: hypothetical protein FWE58_06600 [Methanobrevibacter sp.]|nr:hypothetical protein [Methanobrevibacter sp.]